MRKTAVALFLCISFCLAETTMEMKSWQQPHTEFKECHCSIPFRMVFKLMKVNSTINSTTCYLCLDLGYLCLDTGIYIPVPGGFNKSSWSAMSLTPVQVIPRNI